ncbi:segregation/condensation protein A [Carnobacterium funditum]|uniref:segregation/condensation protein A n=1 Tax=Carnobacterium funditum TaxID=2752 RepID=UPI00054EC471|nr:segregation/condensation protein A [Carnobacterium funditum]
MSEMNIKVAAFEGPLDLLLHLIQRMELDIYDIPIAEVTSQYLNYIKTMKVLKLDVAGDYLIMAATLMAIKSKLLLPKQELVYDDETVDYFEEGHDPREALVEQLLEYQKYKEAAVILKEKEEERNQYYTKEPQNLEYLQKNIPLDPLELTTEDLVVAFNKLLSKRLKKVPLQTRVMAEETTITEKMTSILNQLSLKSQKEGLLFSSLFIEPTKKEMVATLMAMLELIKEKSIIFKQSKKYGEIFIFLVKSNDERC